MKDGWRRARERGSGLRMRWTKKAKWGLGWEGHSKDVWRKGYNKDVWTRQGLFRSLSLEFRFERRMIG